MRLLDESLDPGERSVVADGFHPHADRRVSGDGSRHHSITDALGDRPRLARDHRLVDLGFPVDDRAVGGNTRARADEHDVARVQCCERNGLYSVRRDALGGVGQELGERRERTLCLADRLHLEPMAEQHDDDEERELPPEVEVETADAETGGEARRERHGDRERDQQHHPRLARAGLAHTTAQERPAAVEEDHGAEDRRDPGGSSGEGVADQVGDHPAERDHRDREQQVPPEPLAELLDVVAMPAMPAVACPP